jgi:UTP--glucose-1-phosphate uridylyltransferase
MDVRKAVIPAAGFGTRFLPASKAIPKGMITVVDKPVILYIVEEIVASGIDEIVFVTGSNCKPLEDFFDRDWELEATLEAAGKHRLLEEVRRITDLAEIVYVRQKEQLGNGHAVFVARHAVGDEPFAVLWGDDILLGDPPVTRQLLDVASEFHAPVVGVRRVPPEDYERYGMVAVDPIDGHDRVTRALSVIEKPKRDESPSDLAQIGGFVLTPDIFAILERTPPGPHGEVFLADALVQLMAERPVYAYEFTGARYDAGNKLEYLKATVELALADPVLGPDFRVYLETLDMRSLASPR